MTTELMLQDVHFHYSSTELESEEWAVQQIDVTINQGEYLSIIGSNGSGKSTLARLLNGLLIPSKGTYLINQQPLRDEDALWELKRRVGMVFQNPDNQIVAPSVVDDIAFGLENLGIDRNEMKKRIPEALKQVGLTGLENREPHHLSGGQKQRLAIAGILAMQPDVIIFDEATSMLDPEGRIQILFLMEKLHQQGITIIHITHQAEEAFRAKRVLVMHQGKMLLDTLTEDLYAISSKLADWGLDVPLAVLLHQELLQRNWPLSDKIRDEGQLVSELWTLI
jgi:energy-coupling factor transport system ATP-binding protein